MTNIVGLWTLEHRGWQTKCSQKIAPVSRTPQEISGSTPECVEYFEVTISLSLRLMHMRRTTYIFHSRAV
jgi:hypothetical protein